MLLRGWSIIYEGEERIVGDIERNETGEITQLLIQSHYPELCDEKIVDINKINAILVWRVAFEIQAR